MCAELIDRGTVALTAAGTYVPVTDRCSMVRRDDGYLDTEPGACGLRSRAWHPPHALSGKGPSQAQRRHRGARAHRATERLIDFAALELGIHLSYPNASRRLGKAVDDLTTAIDRLRSQAAGQGVQALAEQQGVEISRGTTLLRMAPALHHAAPGFCVFGWAGARRSKRTPAPDHNSRCLGACRKMQWRCGDSDRETQTRCRATTPACLALLPSRWPHA